MKPTKQLFSFVSLLLCALLLTSCHSDKNTEVATNIPYFDKPDFTPIWPKNQAEIDSLHTLTHFDFKDQNGQKINRQFFSGKIHVANFFFTVCPSLCPRLMANMQAVQKTFKNDPKVLIASYSVTPQIDSVRTLRHYADVHGIMDGKWYLMTGDKKEIYYTARKGYFADENLGVQKGENDFLHTENFILVDKHLHIRGIYNGTLPLEIQQLIEDIKTLEKEI